MKKLIALVLACILAFALAATALAADITIANMDAEEVYNAYKIFGYTKSATGDNYAYTIEESSEWKSVVDTFTYQSKDIFSFKETSDADDTFLIVEVDESFDDTAAVAFAEYLGDNLSGKTATKTADHTGKFADLELGYYFVDTSLGSLCSLVNTEDSQTLYEKNPAPTVEKKVKEGDVWQTYNHAGIGGTVEFQSTITIPANEHNASELSGVENLVLHDVMAEELSWNDDSVTITVDGTALAVDNYTVTAGSDSCNFEVAFNQEYLDTLDKNAHTIVVSYTADLTSAAAADTAYENKTWVSFGENSTSAESATNTYTYGFDLLKYTKDADDNEIQLEEAEFTLRNSEGDAIQLIEVTVGYRVATPAEIADDNVTKTTTIVAGQVNILGLDAGTYTLTETKAPDGYNMLTDSLAVVIAEAKTTNDGDSHTVTVDGEATTEHLVKVENNSGSLLPSTGGMGTTVFYVIGAVLMLGAVVVLVSRKRMAA